ncbi:MAG: HD domain-containing phosphohydrolase [Desulfoplanes sp.]
MDNTCTFSKETNTISCPMRFKSKSIMLCMALIVLIVIGSGIFLYWSLHTKKQTLENEISGHLQTLAAGHATMISAWLDGLVLQGKRLTDADVFRLYATSVNTQAEDISALVTPDSDDRNSTEMIDTRAQQPLMQKMLENFTAFSGFISARAINSKSIPFLSAPQNQLPLSAEQKKSIHQALSLARPVYSSLRKADERLVMDIFLPVLDLSGGEQPSTAIAICIFTVNATPKINSILSLDPHRKQGERTLLVEKVYDTFREVVPWIPQNFKDLSSDPAPAGSREMTFQTMRSLQGDTRVYALGKKVPDLQWWIIEEVETATANQTLRQSMLREIIISVLMTLISCLTLILAWWRIMERERSAIAMEFKNLADENARQKHFLDSINATVPELIGLKDNTGKYTYVNQTFVSAVGRNVSEIQGMDDEALFGFDTGRKLRESDHQALAEDGAISTQATIFLHAIRHIFQISKIPFRNENNERTGILCVYRDITKEADNEVRAQKLLTQTTQALVKAVEMTDPYLAGHSALMKTLSLEMGTPLDLDPQEQQTIEIAATLSQIGKLFVDRKLLAKPGKLTDTERKAMEQHVAHAASILKGIAFDLPVRETILQSNEFLDGSGYPNGLAGEDIMRSARVLCVLNTFCALIHPRSYRSAMSINAALDILEKGSSRYDQDIVHVLKNLIPDLTAKGIIADQEKASQLS